jgi:hypothetical protein
LEKLVGRVTITIDGPGNHAPDEIEKHAFDSLKAHAVALKAGKIVDIRSLGWKLRARPNRTGVTTSEAEYNPVAIANEHRLMPLWYASQFATDGPYILLFVIPYGFGGNPFAINVFNSGVQVFDQISNHVFGPGRSDMSPANAHDRKMPSGVTVADAVKCLSGLALISEPGSGHQPIQRIHLNDLAAHPVTEDQARSISVSWSVLPHP